SWQMAQLSLGARKLLDQVDRQPVEPGSSLSKPATELELKLLVYSEQFHTESGAHVRRLESWDHWTSRGGFTGDEITPERGKLELEKVLASMNRKFKGEGRLPWFSTPSTKANNSAVAGSPGTPKSRSRRT